MYEDEIAALIDKLNISTRIAVLTGAGISAESGIPTFRGEGGLWKKYKAEELATFEAFTKNPGLVWEWYDWRRGIIASKNPNPGHETLSQWEKMFSSFTIITQNIDGLHQKAGSNQIIELHGNIWKVRCIQQGTISENFDVPLKKIPPLCEKCKDLLRPHVVWFGESLETDVLSRAFLISSGCEVMFVVGTSAYVHPAASLPIAASEAGAMIVEINPDPTPVTSLAEFSFRGKSGEILPLIQERMNATHKFER